MRLPKQHQSIGSGKHKAKQAHAQIYEKRSARKWKETCWRIVTHMLHTPIVVLQAHGLDQ